MAIIIEEERNRVNLIALLGWVVVLVAIALAAYFLFIRNPGKIEIVLPGFRATQQIPRIYLDPATIINGPLSERTQYVPQPVRVPVGRPNPFLPREGVPGIVGDEFLFEDQ